MDMYVRMVIAVLCVLSMANQGVAAANPSFTGQWVLDGKASKLVISPKSATLVIKQSDPKLEVVTTSGGMKDTRSYILDGSKRKIDAMGIPMEISAKWQGQSLQTRADGGGMTQSETWQLLDGGKTLSINRTVSGMVSTKELFIYRKR